MMCYGVVPVAFTYDRLSGFVVLLVLFHCVCFDLLFCAFIVQLDFTIGRFSLWYLLVLNEYSMRLISPARYLVKFLAMLAEKSYVNKMTPTNIGIVVGPNLLWSKEESA